MADDPNATDPNATPPGSPPAGDPPKGKDPAPNAGGAGDPPPAGSSASPAGGGSDDNWRDTLSGGDPELRKRLDRYQSGADVAKALVEAQGKIRAGLEPMKAPGKDATPEEVAEYRKAQGIPEQPEGYLESLKGIVIGEEDRPMVDAFLKSAHGINASPVFIEAALNWYNETAEAQASAILESDKQAEQARDDALQEAWGVERRSNLNALENWLSTLGKDANGNPMGDLLKNARLGDGTLLWNSPEMLSILLGQLKEINPAIGVMPAGQSDMNSIASRIREIEKVMVENRTTYNKDKDMQDEYSQLLQARERLKAA